MSLFFLHNTKIKVGMELIKAPFQPRMYMAIRLNFNVLTVKNISGKAILP